MKTRRSIIQQAARGVQLAGKNSITIDGQTFTPDPDTAYVEFHLAHAFPVTTKYRTGIHPQVVANSHRTMVNKVFNLAHIMRKYDKKNNPQDRMLGTVIAVEFPVLADGHQGWTVQGSRENAPGIRAVAVMHKAAQWVDEILSTWSAGRTPFDPEGEWTVSMENTHDIEESGFLVKAETLKAEPRPGTETLKAEPRLGTESGKQKTEIEKFAEGTPADLAGLGYIYVPCMTAPMALLKCLNDEDDDRRDGITSTRVCRDYLGQETILLLNGLDGAIRFQGVGLCPSGMEPEAGVKMMLAAEQMFNLDRVAGAFDEFFTGITKV